MRNLRKVEPYSPARNRLLAAEAYSTVGTAVLFTVRASRDRPFCSPGLASETVSLLREMRGTYGCWVGAYCLMPDHLHFVSGPAREGCSVAEFAERFKGKSTNASWQHGWKGRLWQSRFHDHVLRRMEDLDAVYEYVLNNPVRAGLAEVAAAWRWSGILDGAYGETPVREE